MCSVALAVDGECMASRQVNDGYSHAEKLAPFVDEVMHETNYSVNDLNAIAVSSGPGSYTGLRIGVSLAKGLAYSNALPLISVPTLQIMCLHKEVQALSNQRKELLLCPMLDARRMEVYTSVYDNGLKQVLPTQPMILNSESYSDFLSEDGVLFFGNGASKFKDIIASKSAFFAEDVWPLAQDMVLLSQMNFESKQFEDVAYFEPEYLKEFQATTPKKLV